MLMWDTSFFTERPWPSKTTQEWRRTERLTQPPFQGDLSAMRRNCAAITPKPGFRKILLGPVELGAHLI